MKVRPQHGGRGARLGPERVRGAGPSQGLSVGGAGVGRLAGSQRATFRSWMARQAQGMV